MEIKQIQYFLELARFEHMSQTADYLGIAQSTLSKSISTLERDLGIQLFDRIGNRIKLNHSGEEFYKYAKDAITLLNTAELSAKQSRYETSGTVTIVCTTFAPILMSVIREYLALNPQVSVNVIQYNHDTSSNPAAENCDFILTSGRALIDDREEDPFWVSHELFSEPTYVVIGPQHATYHELSHHSGSIDFRRLKDENFITMKLGRFFTDITYPVCQNAGFFPRSVLQTDDFVVKMRAIREGIGIALLPECCLEEASYLCPGLKAYPITHCETRRSITLMRKRTRMMNETCRDFWEFVMEHYGVEKE